MKRTRALSTIPILLGASLLAACPDRTISKVTVAQGGAETKNIPVSADIDVLFVIDNSNSTADKQQLFASNFPRFVQALDAFPTGRPNLHIGVIDSTVDIGISKYAGCPSPDPQDNGALQSQARVPGCSPPNGYYISDVAASDGTRQKNYSGTLEDTLACIAQVGTSGCGFEAQLEAMKRALDGTNGHNDGFIRPGAYLAIIFLTDEDDASTKPGSGVGVFSLPDNSVGGANDFRLQPMYAYKCDTPITTGSASYTNCGPRTDSYAQDPASYANFLTSVKDPSQIVVAMIAGPPPGLQTNDNPPLTSDMPDIETAALTLGNNTQPIALQPSCHTTINGSAAIGRPGVRLAAFTQAFGTRGRFYSICQDDYSAALADIGKTLFNAVSPCLEGAIVPDDTDPSNPGTQLDCTVTDVVGADTASPVQTLLPACKMSDPNTPDPSSTQPCWWTTMDSNACPAPDTGFELKVERGGAQAPTGTVTQVECAVSS